MLLIKIFPGEINGHYKDVEEDENLGTKIDPAETGRSANWSPDPVVITEVGDKPELMKSQTGCNCERPIAQIRCEAECGFTLRGRLSIPCPAHPGHRHLMDHQPVCPHCGQRLGKLLSLNKVKANLLAIIFYGLNLLIDGADFQWNLKILIRRKTWRTTILLLISSITDQISVSSNPNST